MTVSHTSAADGALATRLQAQRAGFLADGAPGLKPRRKALDLLVAGLQAWRGRLAAAVMADFGQRPVAETAALEILPTLRGIAYLRYVLPDFLPNHSRNVPLLLQPGRAHVRYQPLGVVGIVAPWNYPLHLSALPLVAAFAAGNRALLKLSEFSPRFGACFADLARGEFDSSELSVFHGDAAEAAAFVSLPFDHLLFTGSASVGRRVMAAASAHLVPVTLELGGKSPAVVTEGYDLEHAAMRIVHGKLLNAGQTCVAPDYVLLPRAALEPFAQACARAARQLHPDGLDSADYCSIVDARQYARQCALLDEAGHAGVALHPLFAGAQRDAHRHRLAPVLCVEPPPTLALMREEIFGPLLPLVPYDALDDAIAHIQAGERPLALYWFDDDRARTAASLRAIHAGGVTLNDTLLHVGQDTLPFGGVGESGTGAYHGRWGFDRLSHLKPVLAQPRLGLGALVRPPYRRSFDLLMTLLRRMR